MTTSLIVAPPVVSVAVSWAVTTRAAPGRCPRTALQVDDVRRLPEERPSGRVGGPQVQHAGPPPLHGRHGRASGRVRPDATRLCPRARDVHGLARAGRP